MATLTLRDISAAHGARELFSGLNLVVSDGETWGLTGPNGAGKSTLLRLIADGAGETSPPGATIGLLEQEVERREESVGDFIRRRTGVADAEERMNLLADRLAAGEDVGEDYAAALDLWLALGGADLEGRLARVSAELGLEVGTDTDMRALSGGQAARANLAVVLLVGHDILLLDEPTNDLDMAGLETLERFVASERRPMILVSHDREFLARTVTGMVELDAAQRQITVYAGGYDAFLVERERARVHAREAYEEYAGKVDKLRDRLQTQKTWLDKGTRNAVRRAGDGDKHLRARAAQRSEKQAGKIAQTQRAMERLDEVVEPRKEWELQMSIAAAPRSGSVVSSVHERVIEKDGFTLGPVTVEITQGDRVLVDGPNGAGKSTLLALLTAEENLGSGVVLGGVDQARALFDVPVPLVERFGQEIPDWPASEVRTLLAKFGLTGDHVLRPSSSLSPGERTRAALALLQARGVNTLVLDEPTNHLDLPAIEQLEQAVESFAGTVLLVTHDRRLRENFRATRILQVDGGRVRES